MAKRKRGGFSFLDAKSPPRQPVKSKGRPQNGILIINPLHAGLLEKKRNEILSVVLRTIDKSFLSGTIYEKIGIVETLYIILNMEMNTSATIKDLKYLFGYAKKYIIIENKHLYLNGKKVEPIIGEINQEQTNTNQETHIESKKSIDKQKPQRENLNFKKEKISESLGKKIRIDINMDDIDEFLDYLESRVPERHIRKRYVENIKNLHSNGWNKYRHSTFIDDNKYKVSSKDIEVFVNGMKSRDFNVSVKDYEDALELYLSYRWAKDYSRPMYDDKDEAIPPLVKERKKKEKESPSQETQEGKKIFVNISHLESWESSKKESTSEPKEGQGVVYIGDPTGQRRSVTLQKASISESDHSVDIKIEMTNQQDEKVVVNEDSPTEDVPVSSVEQEITEPEEQNKEESVKLPPQNEVTKEEDSLAKEKTTAKKKMGWFARMMLRFWVWYYKKINRSN